RPDFFDLNQFFWYSNQNRKAGYEPGGNRAMRLDCIAHLVAGKNLILVGPPGSGKTREATALWRLFCAPESPTAPIADSCFVTGNAEWTAYDVVGGLVMSGSGGAQFRPGFLTASSKACRDSVDGQGVPQ